ncbi:bisdemethoxycurcumin synthase-like [Panicum miliaceum]|uniref:Bisdemethoxycurcumin synthase-like n=1 Tax=Panicum miliaceum TaxID=4540 RepID=A0A3L6SF71_PANMI|nr:bisdemethoxycurcumin synthase-like [Panicum miliaceum]
MTSLLGNPIASPGAAINGTRRGARADGPATVLAIGTANPPNCVKQEDYADYYFRVTKSEHLVNLKAKLQRICHKSAIKKRYFHHTEELLDSHPEFTDRRFPSLDARQDIVATAVPELTAAAAAEAIAEWGRPATEITHLVVSTYSGAHMPGTDFHLASLLGLRPTVRRTMLYMNGCSSASAALRVAKDIAENNRGARVLVACAELTLILFRAPHEAHADTLIMQALFGDGAGAVVVGADPVSVEQPDFEMVSASQAMIPESKDMAKGRLREDGLLFLPSREMPSLVRENIERCVVDALSPLDISGGWNDLFWAVHPGGRAILDSVEAGLGLDPRKLEASRHVLREYGNMSGPSVIFVLDELRRQQEENGMGVMVGIGPGISVETMVLRATGSQKKI